MFFGGGGWDRTIDLQIMSLTSYHCSTPRHVPTLYQYIDEVNLLKHGRNRMKGYIRLGVYSKIEKEQHGRITKTRFTPLTREEMDLFRTEAQSMQLIQVEETIENLITEEVSPISTL